MPVSRIHLPVAVVGCLQPVRQALPIRIGETRGVRAGSGMRMRPGDVSGAGTMTGLARHIHVGPGGCVGVGRQVVVLLQVGGVAVGAHVVPGLVAPGPVQPIAGGQPLVGIEMEPALAALLLRAAVPRDAERLKAPAWHGNQVLLQRIDAERIGDLVIMQRAVGAVRAHHELVACARERGDDAEVIELRIGKIAKDRGRRGSLHRLGVVGLLPARGFRCMTCRADLATYEMSRIVSPRSVLQREDGASEDQ